MIKFFLITLLLFCLFFFIKKYSLKKNKKENFSNNKIYLFWTGGYDSTFRLCQALIDNKKIVQPIYVSDIIDNLPSNSTRRKNQKFEMNSMNKIISMLHKQFPYTRRTLLPLKNIKKVNIDNDIAYNMKILRKQKRVRRAVCQYGALAQVTKNLGKNIEICVENEPGSMLNKTMKGKLECKGQICYLKKGLRGYDNSLNIFNKFVFSTIKLTKKDMLKIAQQGNYENILRKTWSCWYPKNNKPCGRCIMCHERIV